MNVMKLFSILLMTFCLVQAATINSCAAGTPQEFKVKAGYLLNIPLFADLPPKPGSCTDFTVCVTGDTPLQEVLKGMGSKRIKNRPVAFKTIDDIPQLDCCQVLFIASSERYRLQRLLVEAHKRGIITISDMRDFVKLGGMVSLVTINNKIGYELNLTAARSASVSFSSQLLKLANDVIR